LPTGEGVRVEVRLTEAMLPCRMALKKGELSCRW